MKSRIVLPVVLLLLAGSSHRSSAQLSMSTGNSLLTYSWVSSFGIRQGDTLQFRVVQINTGTEPLAPTLKCEISYETDLSLGEPLTDCQLPSAMLEPADSVWTTVEAVVESPPGRYALQWSVEGGGSSSGSVAVREPSAESNTFLSDRRLPFVLELGGPAAGDYTQRDFEQVASQALVAGTGPGVLVFVVSEEAAARMTAFSPVLHLRFDLGDRGDLSFSRAWEGDAGALAEPRGHMSQGRFGSALGVGAEVFRILEAEGRRFAGSSR